MPTERIVNVTEFKAKCLAMIAEVESGQALIPLTRRGKIVATLHPAVSQDTESARDIWAGRMHETNDLAATDLTDSREIVNGGLSPR